MSKRLSKIEKDVEDITNLLSSVETKIQSLLSTVIHTRNELVALEKQSFIHSDSPEDPVPTYNDVLSLLLNVRLGVFDKKIPNRSRLTTPLKMSLTKRINNLVSHRWDHDHYVTEAKKIKHIFKRVEVVHNIKIRELIHHRNYPTFDHIMSIC